MDDDMNDERIWNGRAKLHLQQLSAVKSKRIPTMVAKRLRIVFIMYQKKETSLSYSYLPCIRIDKLLIPFYNDISFNWS